jgi:hypothetical protein
MSTKMKSVLITALILAAAITGAMARGSYGSVMPEAWMASTRPIIPQFSTILVSPRHTASSRRRMNGR